MRRLFTVMLVAALLVGAGAAYMLLSAPDPVSAQESTLQDNAAQDDVASDDADDAAEDDADDSTDTEDTERVRRARPDLVGGVLDDLVADGVITQEQADQIVAAFTAQREALRAELQESGADFGRGRRGHPFAHGFGLDDLLEDGIIDADELAELGEDHPLNDPDGPAAAYLDDGQLTQEELDELIAELAPERGRHGSLRGTNDDDDANATEGLFSG